jgi:hypothetical protein
VNSGQRRVKIESAGHVQVTCVSNVDISMLVYSKRDFYSLTSLVALYR